MREVVGGEKERRTGRAAGAGGEIKTSPARQGSGQLQSIGATERQARPGLVCERGRRAVQAGQPSRGPLGGKCKSDRAGAAAPAPAAGLPSARRVASTPAPHTPPTQAHPLSMVCHARTKLERRHSPLGPALAWERKKREKRIQRTRFWSTTSTMTTSVPASGP